MLVWIGLLSGLCSGLFGIGGGIVLVPLLMAFGLPIHQATVLSLQYVCFTGIAGTISHAKMGHVHWDVASLLALGGMVAAPFGTWCARLLPPAILTSLLLIVLLSATLLVLRRSHNSRLADLPINPTVPRLSILGIGLFAGGLAGMLGIGGGFVMTPLLLRMTPHPMKECVGTSLAAVILIALAGSFSNGWEIPPIAWWAYGGLMFGGIGGAIAGARLTHFLSEKRLKQVFMTFVGLLSLFLLQQIIRP